MASRSHTRGSSGPPELDVAQAALMLGLVMRNAFGTEHGNGNGHRPDPENGDGYTLLLESLGHRTSRRYITSYAPLNLDTLPQDALKQLSVIVWREIRSIEAQISGLETTIKHAELNGHKQPVTGVRTFREELSSQALVRADYLDVYCHLQRALRHGNNAY
ncbi:hypothetical protein HYV82_03285 [Candidatus Woesearchaeota archaeon]|nr:hypothetical protein [Candidatus Woesearchaeota archaeon]